MTVSCGMDWSARDGHVCVIDEALTILVQQTVRSEISSLISLLEPFKENLQMVVESPCNWYWLVDGLQEAGCAVCLAHTLGLYMITGAKGKTDCRDALALAKLLKAGMIPKAYSYPKDTRPIRALLRQRARLVALRAGAYGSLRRLRLRHGLLGHSRNDSTQTTDEALQRWFAPPLGRLHGHHELERIALFSSQITTLETQLLATVQDRPEFHRVLTMPGLAKLLAMTIFSAIGALERFQQARAFSSDCRLVPGVAQAGPVSRRGRHAKQGRPHLTWAVSQAAIYAVRYDPRIRRGFDRHRGRHRGKGGKLLAYAIVAQKLAHAVDPVLRDGTVYREELLFSLEASEGDRHPGRLTGRIPPPLIGGGLLCSCRLWICPDQDLAPHW